MCPIEKKITFFEQHKKEHAVNIRIHFILYVTYKNILHTKTLILYIKSDYTQKTSFVLIYIKKIICIRKTNIDSVHRKNDKIQKTFLYMQLSSNWRFCSWELQTFLHNNCGLLYIYSSSQQFSFILPLIRSIQNVSLLLECSYLCIWI